jgi:ribulose-phosphate 3-epimerase
MKPPHDWLAQLPTDRLMAEYSMWSADLVRIADDIARVDRFVDLWHLDVADGVFTPAFLFFPDLMAAARKLTAKPMHVHLMVTDAVLLDQIRQFAEAGADLISIHAEHALADQALALIASLGVRAGVVLKLESPVALAAPLLDRVDFLTLLGTRIGVKGQSLDASAGDRLGEAAALIAASGRRIVLAADGGIRDTTVPLLRKAGAETVVMGSLAFGDPDLPARMAWVHAQPKGV